MPRYYHHDLNSDKVHIFTGGKADWLTFPPQDRDAFKRNCLWSGSRNCWVSRSKGKSRILMFLGETLKRLGFEDRGEVGSRLSFAEKVAEEQSRAADRADRMEDRAAAAQKEADGRFKASDAIVGQIPMGQPILVGHHSEKRHRNALKRSDNHMRAGIEATEKRKHYEDRASTARSTADGAKYSNPAFLGRRIKECETEMRRLLRNLKGATTNNYRDALTTVLAEVGDKLEFYRHCRATCGAPIFDRQALKGKQEVLIRGTWHKIVRLNPTTVAVPNICFPTPESQVKYAMKYLYSEVKDAK
jgi:hypothetical protein